MVRSMNAHPFVLVPAVGHDHADILRDWDGQSAAARYDQATCQHLLEQGLRPMRVRETQSYSTPPSADRDCLALMAAARGADRIGVGPLAEILTTRRIVSRQAMEAWVATSLAPRPDLQSPQPSPDRGR